MTTAEARTILANMTTVLGQLDALKQAQVDPYAAAALQEALDQLASTLAFWQGQ